MKLHGACLQAFIEWFLKSDNREILSDACNLKVGDSITEAFYSLPDSAKYGVYVDFFDSVGIYISNKSEGYKPIWYEYNIKHGLEFEFSGKYDSRPKARTESIQKACELFNGK